MASVRFAQIPSFMTEDLAHALREQLKPTASVHQAAKAGNLLIIMGSAIGAL